MGRMKDTIPEEYSCIHYLDVEDCFECQHAMMSVTEWNASQFPSKEGNNSQSLKDFHNKKKRRRVWKRK